MPLYVYKTVIMNGYSQVPNKWGIRKKFQNVIRWDQNKWEVGIRVTGLNEYTRTERTKAGCHKHTAKIYRNICYFALEIGRK